MSTSFNLGVSLWLEPSPSSVICNSLQSTIRSLKPLFDDAPTFRPHLTVTSQINIDPNSQEQISAVLNGAKIAAQCVDRIDVVFSNITYGSKFFKKVYLSVDPSLELLSLARICREEFVILPRLLLNKRRSSSSANTSSSSSTSSPSSTKNGPINNNITTTGSSGTSLPNEPSIPEHAATNTKENIEDESTSPENLSNSNEIENARTSISSFKPTHTKNNSSVSSTHNTSSPKSPKSLKTKPRSNSNARKIFGGSGSSQVTEILSPPLAPSSPEYKEAARQAAHEASEWMKNEFEPHVSLVYSSAYPIEEALQETVNSRLRDVFGENFMRQKFGFKGSRLSLVYCEGPVSEWKVLGYRDI